MNDTPANLTFLKELGFHLIDIHSQHQNLLISKEDFQLHILDVMAQNHSLLEQYHTCFSEYRQTEQELKKAKEDIAKSRAEEDYLLFQLEQLEELNPKAGEDEELEKEQSELSHAEEIKNILFKAEAQFSNDSDQGVLIEVLKHYLGLQTEFVKLDVIDKVVRLLTATALAIVFFFIIIAVLMYPAIEEYAERLESALIELKDINAELGDLAERVEYNPARLEEINNRLDKLYTLEKKHEVKSTADLEAFMLGLRQKLDIISNGEERIDELEKAVKEKLARTKTLAEQLCMRRTSAAREVEAAVTSMLTQLDIPNNKFEVKIEKNHQLTENGIDKVTFFFSANKNAPMRAISEVASGGEIARLMLALKALTSKRENLPTIIFDEIDTGVSGKVPSSMANLMKEMTASNKHQVITITHLPQIASCGTTHYWVYKEDTDDRTFSHIRELTPEERVTEIAHM